MIRPNVTRTHHGVGVGGPLQVVAALGVGVRSDAQAVGRVELLHQEGAARLDHGGQLEEAGGREQRLDGVLPQLQAACGGQGKRSGGRGGMSTVVMTEAILIFSPTDVFVSSHFYTQIGLQLYHH